MCTLSVVVFVIFFFLLKSCYYVKSTPSESNGYVSRVLTAGSQGAGTVF